MNSTTFLPTFNEIQEIFCEEIQTLGANVKDMIATDDCLFARATFDSSLDVSKGDTIHKGVAMRVFESEVSVYPYTLRQVCTNGSIAPMLFDFGVIERPVVSAAPVDVNRCMEQISHAIAACSSDDTFAQQVGQMRKLSKTKCGVVMALQLLELARDRYDDESIMLLLNQAPSRPQRKQRLSGIHRRRKRRAHQKSESGTESAHLVREELRARARRSQQNEATGIPVGQPVNPLSDQQTVGRITRQFEHEDNSMFGLMNAVTAVARETEDPALRWELEKLGGRFMSLAGAPAVSNRILVERRDEPVHDRNREYART